MLLSMTGYGKASDAFQGRTYTIDVKTLNGKLSDLRLKGPTYLRSKEIELRKIIMESVMRGKIDCTITVQESDADADYQLNFSLIEYYLNQLNTLSDKFDIQNSDLLQTIIRIPNVVKANDEEIGTEEWQFLCDLTQKAISDLNTFRKKEGLSMLDDLNNRVTSIQKLLGSVEQLEEDRKKELLDKIRTSIESNIHKDKIDENRLEQEIVYYLEKLDIHEEKIRLSQHCNFFMETAKSELLNTGKKLGFIAQEMGREINTLGSKAQYSPLQQIVVDMKVELDKIKEQLANVL